MKKKNREEYVKICPKCGSTEVHVDFSNPVIWAYGTPPKYQCKSCGHIAIAFPDVNKKEVDEFKSKISQSREQKEQIVDVKTGTTVFYMEIIIIIIVGFIAVLLGVPWAGVLLLAGGLFLIKLTHKK